jgi:hypothetical protein
VLILLKVLILLSGTVDNSLICFSPGLSLSYQSLDCTSFKFTPKFTLAPKVQRRSMAGRATPFLQRTAQHSISFTKQDAFYPPTTYPELPYSLFLIPYFLFIVSGSTQASFSLRMAISSSTAISLSTFRFTISLPLYKVILPGPLPT